MRVVVRTYVRATKPNIIHQSQNFIGFVAGAMQTENYLIVQKNPSFFLSLSPSTYLLFSTERDGQTARGNLNFYCCCCCSSD